MGAVSLVKSCLCNSACYANPDAQSHCGGGRFVVNPAPLPGLPSCGNPFNNVSGFSGSTCAVSLFNFVTLYVLRCLNVGGHR